jgi:hypothetical protein
MHERLPRTYTFASFTLDADRSCLTRDDNNVNFSNPAGILDNPDFGQIRSTVTSQRQIQFGLKLIF